MPDREKTIADLQKVADVKRDTLEIDGLILNPFVIIPLMKDALALLKEQETSNTGKARIFQCEKCGYGFDDIFLTDEHNYDIEPNYCPNCGRSVKWDA